MKFKKKKTYTPKNSDLNPRKLIVAIKSRLLLLLSQDYY